MGKNGHEEAVVSRATEGQAGAAETGQPSLEAPAERAGCAR
jgi:hypothetical protein